MSLRSELLRLALRATFKLRDDVAPDIAAIRARLEKFKYLAPPPPKGTQAVRLAMGGVPAIRVTTPRSRPDRHVLYLHGGGYVYGRPAHYRDFIWRIANAAAATMHVADYRLGPEHPFPAAVDDAVSAYRSLIAAGADPRHLAIMGDSAGGGLTFATLLRLRDERVEACFVVQRDVRQNLTVQVQTRDFQSVQELAVGNTGRAARGVDADDPQRTILALLVLAADVCELQTAFDSLLGCAVELAFREEVAGSLFQHLFTGSPAVGPSFNSGHVSSPCNCLLELAVRARATRSGRATR